MEANLKGTGKKREREQRGKKSSEIGFLQTRTRNFTVEARKLLIRIILVTKYWARGHSAGLVNAYPFTNFSEVSFYKREIEAQRG